MLQKENIKIFVRETLGCECPEKVFEFIDIQHYIKLNSEVLINDKINVGNRLLIYVIEIHNSKFIKSNLSKLISSGKDERDKNGFNRFRLAIVTDKMNEIKQISQMAFENIKDKDEKIHIHLINRNEISIL